jgi:hypothetical protein
MSLSSAIPIPTVTSTALKSICASFNLPAGGVIFLPNGSSVTLTAAAAFKPSCTPDTPAIVAGSGGGSIISVEETSSDSSTSDPQASDFRDPFYASTFPQCYALAATTIIAYTLVIMLFITPRSFLDGGIVVLGRRGFTNGGSGVNIGGRPWLQKVAALTVAISLTIATVDTFRVAEEQYGYGIENANRLQSEVMGGTELKVIRIISDTFLWLAQAQTLIRLFPRHREKVIIKWTAFALIILDVIFQCLNSFQYEGPGSTRPTKFTDAVPALNYLFELSLGVLYAAWVIYYSLMKKRYAFYHPQMKNMILVATLSIFAILVPIVFFILDVSEPDFTGWGDYVRWVGAAAASVIVWEWVERIEALEREEKKDGILGREVFDGDEIELNPTEFAWPRRRKRRSIDGDDFEKGKGSFEGKANPSERPDTRRWPSASSIVSRYRSGSRSKDTNGNGGEAKRTDSNTVERKRFLQPPLWPSRPPPAVTPISRTETASAASTVYAVRYHPLTETTSRTTPPPNQGEMALSRSDSVSSDQPSDNMAPNAPQSPEREPPRSVQGETAVSQASPGRGLSPSSSSSRWQSLARGMSLPRPRRTDDPNRVVEDKALQHEDAGRWDFKARLEDFAATQAEKLRERFKPTPDTDNLPVMVIPAPPRPGAALAQLREEEELLQPSPISTHSPITTRTFDTSDGLSPTLLHTTMTGYSASSRPLPSPNTQSQTTAVDRRTTPVVHVIPAPSRRDSD